MSNKDERISIRVTPELKQKLQSIAQKEGRTISNFVHRLLVLITAKEPK